MELISDIINSLIDDTKSLNNTLLKTKVLASRINNSNLLSWVNSELSGYPNDESLPDYRKNIVSHIKGDYIVGSMKYSNQPIPTSGMNDRFGINVNKTTFRQGISSLEELSKTGNSETLMLPFPAEIVGFLEQNWRTFDEENGYYLNLINARKIIPRGAITEIVSQVKNRLLDFMLEIDNQYGNITEIKDLSSKNKEITQIMKQTIINNTGDGNLLNTGDSNEIKSSISINKGNKEELIKALRDSKISNEDIQELVSFIDDDNANTNSNTFGEHTQNWIQKMIGKALNKTWEIGISAAGGLLSNVIGKYLGL